MNQEDATAKINVSVQSPHRYGQKSMKNTVGDGIFACTPRDFVSQNPRGIMTSEQLQINAYYPEVLVNESLFEKMLEECRSVYAPGVQAVLRKKGAFTRENLEDALNEGSLRIIELCKKNLNGKVPRLDWYSYLLNVYKRVACEVARKYGKINEYEHAEESGKNPSVQRNLPDAQSMMEQTMDRHFEVREARRKYQGMMIALSEIKQAPHQVAAFCYSVMLPPFVRGYIQDIYYQEYDKEESTGRVLFRENMERVSECSEKNAGIYLEELYKACFSELDQKYRISLQALYSIYFIIPLLYEYIKKETKEKRSEEGDNGKFVKQCQEAYDYLKKKYPKEQPLEYRASIRVLSAKLMLRTTDTVGFMLEAFQTFYNIVGNSDRRFLWGLSTLEQLEKPYEDRHNHIFLPVEKTIVFWETFSEEGKEKALDHNLYKFSESVKKTLVRGCVEYSEEAHYLEPSQGAYSMLDNYMRRKNIRGRKERV